MHRWLVLVFLVACCSAQRPEATSGPDFTRAARPRGSFYLNGVAHQYLQGRNYTVVAAAVPVLGGKFFGVKLRVLNRSAASVNVLPSPLRPKIRSEPACWNRFPPPRSPIVCNVRALHPGSPESSAALRPQRCPVARLVSQRWPTCCANLPETPAVLVPWASPRPSIPRSKFVARPGQQGTIRPPAI